MKQHRQHYENWVLLTLVLAALPSLVTLPIWVAGIAFAGTVLHYITALRKSWSGKVAGLTLLCAAVVGIWLSFESLFSGKSVLSFFIVVVFLKWGETRTRRDYLLLIFAAVILAAIGALYWENLWSMMHLLVVILSLTMSLVAIHGDPSVLSFRFLIRMGGQLFLLGLPLMLLLFLTFPRVPGPLWDIGLAFGMPVKAMIDRGPSDYGKTRVLEPGGIQKASQENTNVLVAEFEGAVPFKSSLYWRGPVFWEYDGANWTLPENWNNRTRLLKGAINSQAKLDRELRMKGRPVNYTLRVMPNGGRWLYGLDVPAMPAPEAFISEDFQLLSIREIDDSEPKFPMLAYLDYQVGSTLTAEDRARGLAWPEGTNPRLQALGEELAEGYQDSGEIVLHAFRLLAEGGYQFDGNHLLDSGPDLLDRYFFDEKKGGAEYLAGSFAMLMRAAGVPARLVSGYRGGTIIALTNFVIVKRSDAHAWLEVWHEGKGWVKVEPKDIVLPTEQKAESLQSEEVKAPETRVEIQIFDATAPDLKSSGPRKSNSASGEDEGKRWELPSFTSLFGNLRKWFIHYDPDRQMDLLEEVGMEESNWLDLLLGGVAGVLSLLCFYLGIAQWRGRTRVDPVTKAWLKFCARLTEIGLEKMPQECPRDFLQRACREQPELEDAIRDVIGRYIDIRYGEARPSEEIAIFRRQVERFVAMT
ncbi:MAG: transglutaminase-like putative cysteine protease [Lentimonas sp.]|jgi:transglutaminase-like putative cysteine protease